MKTFCDLRGVNRGDFWFPLCVNKQVISQLNAYKFMFLKVNFIQVYVSRGKSKQVFLNGKSIQIYVSRGKSIQIYITQWEIHIVKTPHYTSSKVLDGYPNFNAE